VAARVQYTNIANLKAAKALKLTSNLDYEHVQQQFRPLERLRYVEFTREWGLPLTVQPVTEDILRFSTELKDKQAHALNYQFMNYKRSDQYNGYQNIIQHGANLYGWKLQNQFAVTNFSTAIDKGYFLRPVIDISKQLKKMASMQLGFRYALERNKVNNKTTDEVSPTSFSFDTYTVYLKTDDNKKNRYGINFFTRADEYPVDKGLVKGDRSYNINLTAELLKSEKHQFIFNATFRQLEVFNSSVSQQKEDRTLLGRAEYQINEWKGFITGNVLYDIGAGQEQRRDFAYIEVPAGQGQFTWIDYNGDGIQTLNEFEVAVFQDQAKFIRLLVPTNEFIKAAFTTLNYSFSFNPKVLFKASGSNRWQRFVSRLNFQTSMQKTKRSIASGDFEFNPFKSNIENEDLLTLNTIINNTLSFNRFSSRWGVDFSNLQSSGKALLSYGYESRKVEDWIMKLRWVISPSFSFNLLNRKGLNALYTPAFEQRNYELDILSSEPQLTFINRTTFRLQASYKLDQKKNASHFGGEKSVSNAINLETKYNVLQNTSILARATYNNIRYNHPTNTAVSFIMLDGLLPGSNYLWSIDFTKRLFNNVELNLQYEGRQPASARTVHIGRAAVRALF
jgi:hypothetical protein